MPTKAERTGRGEAEESLEQLHGRILDGMAELTLLTNEFKVRQEGHFLRTFMGVLERMGNDLVVAQEAYRNIDIDIKREKYYQEIAIELSFFKQECFTLKAQHLRLTTHAKAAALDQDDLRNQLNSIKHTLQVKCDQNLALRGKLQTFRTYLKQHRLVPTSQLAKEIEESEAGPKTDVAQQWVQTQQHNRGRILESQCLKRDDSCWKRDDQCLKQEEGGGRYSVSSGSKFRSTNNSSFRRRSNEKTSGKRPSVFFD